MILHRIAVFFIISIIAELQYGAVLLDDAEVNVRGGDLGMLVPINLLSHQVQSHFQLVNGSLQISKAVQQDTQIS
jgi:hypothetical protein